jgi:DtxR family Mn-dependent transcriptional regulator
MSSTSESVEMYLKSIAELGGVDDPVPIGRVAERLGVSPVSASEMMKRLGEQHLIKHLPYKGVVLTDRGRLLANSVIRRQRLWECFLVDELKLDWAQAYELSCNLEHATDSEVTQALATYLNHPEQCPHGNPIPDEDGRVDEHRLTPLISLPIDRPATIRAISPENSDVLAYLGKRGIRPGQRVVLTGTAPLQGPLTIKVGQANMAKEIDLGQALASLVHVELEVSN